MKIIHTADWHLGQNFKGYDREEEHGAFLVWLDQLLQTEQPDALLISGDIFDSAHPPHHALVQYYEFLSKARQVCPTIIITGGNHDSRYVLNAPRNLLKYMNIHIIGGGVKIDELSDMAKQIVAIKNRQGVVVGAVAAVPFLREGDVRSAVAAGETYEEKVRHLRTGIKDYYAKCLELMHHYAEQKLPLLAMGHLYAAGSQLSDDEAEGRSERRIYAMMGNQAAMDIDIFPSTFHYVALGHIHKPQIVGKMAHVRYSGSPIPLSFGELHDQKQVVSVSFADNVVTEIRPIKVPLYRKLLRLAGTPEELSVKIAALHAPFDETKVWAEIIVHLPTYSYAAEQEIKALLEDKNILVLPHICFKSTIDKKAAATSSEPLFDNNFLALEDLNSQPHTVFLQRCKDLSDQEQQTLIATFEELMATIEL